MAWQLILDDSFTHANTSPGSAGSTTGVPTTPATGAANGWEDLAGGVYSIQSDQLNATVSTSSFATQVLFRTVETGNPDCRIVLDTAGNFVHGCAIIRYVSSGNFYLCEVNPTTWAVYAVVSGSPTTIAGGSISLTTTDLFEIDFSASSASPSTVDLLVTDTTTSTVVINSSVSDSTSALQASGLSFGVDLFAGSSQTQLFSRARGYNFTPSTGFTASPASAASSKVPISVALTGTGTSWTSGTVFSVSGGTAAAVTGQTVISGTSAIICLVTGTSAGTLTLSDGTYTQPFTVTSASPVDYAPTASGLQFYGRWNVQSTGAVSINSGSSLEFSFAGSDTCKIGFDLTSVDYGPEVVTVIDGGAPTRQAITTAAPTISLSPVYNSGTSVASHAHTVQLWLAGVYQGQDGADVQATVNQWTNQLAAAKLLAIELASGGSLLPSGGVSPNQIEFLGDSITASIREILPNGSFDSTQQTMASHISFAILAARILGLKPSVVGFGAQGVTTGGAGGVPAAPAAFPFIYNGVSWSPSVEPIVVVLYQGTNDAGASSGTFQTDYAALLAAVRSLYPSAYVFAVNPYNVSRLTQIEAAISGDSRAFALDYSSGVYGSADTNTLDGQHPNPGGHAKMAAKLATDIQTQLNTLGVKVQPTSGGDCPTAVQIRQEMDANSTQLALIVARTGAPVALSATGADLIPGWGSWSFPQTMRAVAQFLFGKRSGVPTSGTGGTVTYTQATPGDYGTVTVDTAGNITGTSLTPPS